MDDDRIQHIIHTAVTQILRQKRAGLGELERRAAASNSNTNGSRPNAGATATRASISTACVTSTPTPRARVVSMATSNQPPRTRIILWGVPMCLSTVFTRCVSARGDAEIFVEPFDNCHSFGPERRMSWPAEMGSSGLLNEWQTYGHVKSVLEKDYPAAEIVFVKDMAFAIDGRYDMLPVGYRHTFLIRDPRKVWSAYHKRIRQLLAREETTNGGEEEAPRRALENLEGYVSPTPVFKASFDLMEYARTALHQEPVVIDAGDLADRPAATLLRYCSAVGIPYTDSMLTLDSSISSKWHCSEFFSWAEEKGGFYSKALRSTEFLRQKDELHTPDLPPEVVECVVRSQQWYEKMYALRLKPE